MSDTTYAIDLDSIRSAFPPGLDAPPLLSEAQADLARAPRPERWVPKWLA